MGNFILFFFRCSEASRHRERKGSYWARLRAKFYGYGGICDLETCKNLHENYKKKRKKNVLNIDIMKVWDKIGFRLHTVHVFPGYWGTVIKTCMYTLPVIHQRVMAIKYTMEKASNWYNEIGAEKKKHVFLWSRELIGVSEWHNNDEMPTGRVIAIRSAVWHGFVVLCIVCHIVGCTAWCVLYGCVMCFMSGAQWHGGHWGGGIPVLFYNNRGAYYSTD